MIGAVEDENLERVSPSTASSRMMERLRPLRRDACSDGLALGARRPSADRAVGCDRSAQPSTVE
eukprot:10419993-Heterocapsa_arctica.AAC.1